MLMMKDEKEGEEKSEEDEEEKEGLTFLPERPNKSQRNLLFTWLQVGPRT